MELAIIAKTLMFEKYGVEKEKSNFLVISLLGCVGENANREEIY